MRPDRGAIQIPELPVHVAGLVGVFAQRRDDARPEARPLPARKAAIDGLPRAIALGQIPPRRARGQDPEHPVEDRAMIPIIAALCLTWRQQGGEERPRRIGEFMTVSHTPTRQQQPTCSLAVGYHRLSNTA